jgi:ketosteroid isomerase-like protein
MKTIKESIDHLNGQIMQGNILGAFDELYADDVVMQENNDEPRVGKASNRAYEEKFVASLEGFHGAEIRSVNVNETEGTSTVEWMMDVTIKEAGRMKLEQVAAQRWKDGKIVSERFYYKG